MLRVEWGPNGRIFGCFVSHFPSETRRWLVSVLFVCIFPTEIMSTIGGSWWHFLFKKLLVFKIIWFLEILNWRKVDSQECAFSTQEDILSCISEKFIIASWGLWFLEIEFVFLMISNDFVVSDWTWVQYRNTFRQRVHYVSSSVCQQCKCWFSLSEIFTFEFRALNTIGRPYLQCFHGEIPGFKMLLHFIFVSFRLGWIWIFKFCLISTGASLGQHYWLRPVSWRLCPLLPSAWVLICVFVLQLKCLVFWEVSLTCHLTIGGLW